MIIEFANNKLKKQCTTFAKARRAWGDENAKKLMRRLSEIRASDNLEVLCGLPFAGCHPLKGNRRGQFAVYLKHPHRVVFRPAGDPNTFKEGNAIKREQVDTIKILRVEDYHD